MLDKLLDNLTLNNTNVKVPPPKYNNMMILAQSVRLILQVIVEFILILFWITKATNLGKKNLQPFYLFIFTFVCFFYIIFYFDFHVYFEFSYLFIVILLFYLLENNHTKEGF